MEPLSYPFTEITRAENMSGWYVSTQTKNYFVADLWLTDLGMTIEHYASFIRNHGFAPNPKNSPFVFRA